MNQFYSSQPVKVIDADYERFGQVGAYCGPGNEPGEVAVRFDGPEGHEMDTFPTDAIGAL